MASVQAIIETVLGYPGTAIIKDFKNLAQGHKPYRNGWRILCGAVGSTLGGLIPTLFATDISHYTAGVIQAVIPISSVPSYVTGSLVLVYIGLTAGLVTGKFTAKIYYHCRYHDTNSGHLLYDHELHHTMKLYQNSGLNESMVEIKIRDIFQHLVIEIRRSKTKNTGNPLEPISLSWTKPQLKGVMYEFMNGNEDPYAFFYRLSHMKQNFLQARLKLRVDEIDNLLLEERPTPQGYNQAYVRPNTPRGANLRHQRRASVSAGELKNKHPKLHRYLTQVAGEGHDGERKAEELEQVKTLLLSKSAQVSEATRMVPAPMTEPSLSGLRSPPPFGRGLRLDI